jgi:O-antigen ligase
MGSFEMLERIGYALVVALVAWLPFEFRAFPMASNLQWLFVCVAAVFLPTLYRKRKELLRERLVLAALLFVATQWVAAFVAPEFRNNAILGAVRVTAGFTLLCVTLCLRERKTVMRAWCLTATLAALYGILDYNGFGMPELFRMDEFYVGAVRRLSGSFEYPNTAAAFFAMSLPLVWGVPNHRWMRVSGSILLWIVIILTYSRGAMIAVLLMLGVWSIATKSRALLVLGGLCLASAVGFITFQPFLIRRFEDKPPGKVLAAEYQPTYNTLRRRPGEQNDIMVRIKNVGTATWITNENGPFTLTYRWYDPERLKWVPKSPTFLSIPAPLRPGESLDVHPSFLTPREPGLYLLTWDISQHGKNWFSGNGVWPGLVEVDVQPDGEILSSNRDLSRWYLHPISRLFVANNEATRMALWKAALEMARDHPVFGIGPDNFRLLYGESFRITRPDTKIRANSLYLELLSGSGLAGLVAFGIMVGAMRWSAAVAPIASGIFLIHGFVDAFLMTTPIYFGFWILLGLAQRDYDDSPPRNASAT